LNKAEFVTLSEVSKEIKLVKQMLQATGYWDICETTYHCMDWQVGTMFEVEDVATTHQTKHMDICYHFIRVLFKRNFFKSRIFINTTDNAVDCLQWMGLETQKDFSEMKKFFGIL